MRIVITLLLVLIAAVIVAVAVLQEPGYVLVVYEQWSVETTLSFFIGGLIVSFALLYLAIRLIHNIWLLPQRLRELQQSRRRLRARVATHRGLTALAEGYWAKAEKYLLRYAADSEVPLINYLGAARAAQEQGATTRRDLHLSDAHHMTPRATLAIGITQAELQMAQGQHEEALATLLQLRTVDAKHPFVLRLLQRLYEKMGSWNELLELLPELRAHGVLKGKAADEVENKVYQQLLAIAANANSEALRTVWEKIPREIRKQGDLLATYVRHLLLMGAGGAECEELLRDAIKHHYDAQLVRLYGQVSGSDLNKQLATAEGWLRDHERDPDLLLTLGRLALRNQLWGKGRNYLEASLGSTPQPETYCELANLLHDLGEDEKARELYRQGLQSAAKASCALPGDRPRPRRRIQPGAQ